MTTWLQHNRMAVHFGVLGLVLILISAVLLVGYETTTEIPPEIEVGASSPERFTASERQQYPDDAATEAAREDAAAAVDDIYASDPAAEQAVFLGINNFYRDLEEGAYADPEPPDKTAVPDVIGFSVADAEFAIIDAGLVPVRAPATLPTEIEERDGTIATTNPTAGAERDEGTEVVLNIYVWTESSTTTQAPTTTTTIPEDLDERRIDPADQVANLLPTYVTLGEDVITDFVTLHENDIDRVLAGEESVFDELQTTTIGWAEDELDAGIRSAEELQEVQQKYLLDDKRPPMSIAGLPEEDFDIAHAAVGTLVARTLQVNEQVDQVATDAARQAASDAVPEQFEVYEFGEVIAEEGEPLTSIQVQAITDMNLYEPTVSVVAPRYALALVAALSVLLFVFLLFRIAPQNLERTRDVVLLAIILVLTVVVARVPDLVTGPSDHAIGYVIPAVTIGMMVAILFDQRTALLMAIPMAGFTAIATSDITFTVYAAIATIVPVAFVSAVSTRAQLRLSVMGSAAVAAPIAGALEYLFRYGADDGGPWMAMLWAFIGAFLGGFLAQGIVSFLETAFGVTTTMSLLDLLDRNHPALQELEEKAPGRSTTPCSSAHLPARRTIDQGRSSAGPGRCLVPRPREDGEPPVLRREPARLQPPRRPRTGRERTADPCARHRRPRARTPVSHSGRCGQRHPDAPWHEPDALLLPQGHDRRPRGQPRGLPAPRPEAGGQGDGHRHDLGRFRGCCQGLCAAGATDGGRTEEARRRHRRREARRRPVRPCRPDLRRADDDQDRDRRRPVVLLPRACGVPGLPID